MLDQVFGSPDRKRSPLKKRRQVFDEKTNVHVFLIENRVLRRSTPIQRDVERPASNGG